MDAKLILLVVAVGAVCFALGALVARSRRRDGQMLVRQAAPSPPAFPAARAAPGEAIDERLRQLLRENKLIEAIKLYRERTGCSLKEAKEAVEAERARAAQRGGQTFERPVDSAPVRSSFGDAARRSGIDVKLAEQLLQMLTEGRRAEALWLVRERTGLSEAEAEAALARYESLKGRLGL